MRQLIKGPFKLMGKMFKKVFNQSECFVLEVSTLPNGETDLKKRKSVLRLKRSHWHSLMHPPIMQADPFLFAHKGRLHLFYEEMLFEKGLGVIKMTSTTDLKTWTKPRTITSESATHFSYPFVFEDVMGGGIFLMPETGCDHNIRLYKALDDSLLHFGPSEILLERKGISNKEDKEGIIFDYADSNILHHHGKFYLFTSVLRNGEYELELYFSDRLKGPYSTHPRNPVARGNATARCGGSIIRHGNRLYRPAQDCEKVYGGQLHLYEITSLTPDTYSERKVVDKIIPESEKFFRQGGHHLNTCEFLGQQVIAMDARFTTSFLLERMRFKVAKKFNNAKRQ